MSSSFQRLSPATSSLVLRKKYEGGDAIGVLPRIDKGKGKHDKDYKDIFYEAVLHSYIEHPDSQVAQVFLRSGWTFQADPQPHSGTKFLFNPNSNPVLYFTLRRDERNTQQVDFKVVSSSKQNSLKKEYITSAKVIPEILERNREMLEQQVRHIQTNLSRVHENFSQSLDTIAEQSPKDEGKKLTKKVSFDPKTESAHTLHY